MVSRPDRPAELRDRFAAAVASLDRRFGDEAARSADESQEVVVRQWLDGADPLPWAGPGVTPDEWFFITTL
jgi:hypothetical protein